MPLLDHRQQVRAQHGGQQRRDEEEVEREETRQRAERREGPAEEELGGAVADEGDRGVIALPMLVAVTA